ncbi:alpha/beta-hydrolase [Hortaea werneckii]|uniref:Xaa-Pro dipeptidyl-peptidase C-terminal domain-containing protein n=1 Tax=Hortaea werneckii TaxID=91943 RepID=A0A3M7GSH1_HORWE|nr:alpha/beta-hydrolase [Hortaea werneckii]KAI7346546.1 alpha/beta-hydrolase [Hortaea werneckii]KAI7571483.1 alpha/beta-hydrolase [Hortaea werneckii]KAI7626262.1 alpha/beta-hydrolase [Hortaea werneckii]KAI7636207.1 alpha/beta-hydrolase [Hortaea werneckii]
MPLAFQPALKRLGEPKVGENGFAGFRPGETEIFRAGSKPFGEDTKALKSDIQLNHDVEVVVRDGARLYIDVYRPADAQEKVPAVLSWSPYGKKYSSLDMLPMTIWHSCVKRSDLSGLEKFEGLDPADWCPRGYAIVSVDARGAGNNDGYMGILGSQEAEDGYDVVEAVARMPWCNGNIGMAGNSYLAISQWFIASQSPPSLKAIAPWEGLSDLYREQFCRGGWFSMHNFDLITKEILRGKPTSGIEDVAEMYRRSPTMTPFWQDKRVDFSQVQCPVYIRGSDVSGLHNMGSIRAWMQIPHEKKWIRWGAYQEWFELYSEPGSQDELVTYFNHYLRGEPNDWETNTPRVRWDTLRFGDSKPVHDIILEDFPVPNTQYETFYLSGSNKLSDQLPTAPSTLTYNSEDRDSWVEFTHTFKEPSRLLGLPKAVLYMSCKAQDDFVVFVILRKKDKNGKDMMHLNFPFDASPINSIAEIDTNSRHSVNTHEGQMGILRASQRRVDESKSMHPQFPFHPHDKQEKIPPGTVVKLEIGIWALGIDFDAGESISLRIGGQNHTAAEFTAWSVPRPDHELNHGEHEVHFGGEYPSSVILPYVGQP